MSLGRAISFVKKFNSDSDFRADCNGIESKNSLLEKYDFNESEFEEAINMELVKCQSYEEADSIQEIKFWFNIFK